MAKSGIVRNRFIQAPPRKAHRRTSTFLTEEQRYLVACDLMDDVRVVDIAYKWGISQSYISRIKFEFLEVVVVWKPGVLDKFKGIPEKL